MLCCASTSPGVGPQNYRLYNMYKTKSSCVSVLLLLILCVYVSVCVWVCLDVGVGVQFLRTCRHFVQSVCCGKRKWMRDGTNGTVSHTQLRVRHSPVSKRSGRVCMNVCRRRRHNIHLFCCCCNHNCSWAEFISFGLNVAYELRVGGGGCCWGLWYSICIYY